MRRIWMYSMVLGLYLALTNATSGQDDFETTPIDLELAMQYFKEARAISDRDGGAMWGLELMGPLLFVDRATRFVVTNQPDKQNQLTKQGDLHVGTLPDTKGIANTSMTWSGVQWTMLMWPLPEDPDQRNQLLAHEMFHRIQDDLNLELGMPDNRHLDEHDGRLWLRLEWRALKMALESDGKARHMAMTDALLFRGARHALYPNQIADELNLELNEGLAQYTGISLGLDSIETQCNAAIQGLASHDRHRNFIRSFAYASGPAYGLLIDKAGLSEWRSKLTVHSDLGKILAEAYAIDLPSPSEAMARERWSPYEGSLVLLEEDERHQEALKLQATFKARFEDNPTLILPLNSFPNYTFNPNRIKAFGDVGSVYLSTRVVSDWGILDVTSGGALFVQQDGVFLRIVVPTPFPDSKGHSVEGDGYTLKLNEGWTIKSRGDTQDLIAQKEK
ncbi:MAG: hypothetical protein O7G85_09425 [Planctomycetota bacterium]|nr:hypothetical protein [Planctomycetota bacterium]